MNYTAILAATIPVYLAMVAGALMRRLGVLPKAADHGIMRLVVCLLSPSLVFERIVNNPILNDAGQVLLGAALGFAVVTVTILLSYAAAPLLGLKRGAGARTFGLCTGLQNYGFVAIPVVEALFPEKGRQLVGVLFTLSLGIEVALWTTGVGLLTGLSKAPWRHALNPPVFTIAGSLLLHFSGVGPHVPGVIHSLAGMLGGCAIPVSLLLIGATILDCFSEERMNWAVAAAAPVLRQFILPFGFLLAGLWLPWVSDDLKRILVVQAAMPSAVFTIIVARHYGGHPPTAMQVIISTTIVSVFSAPWMIGFGMKFLGL